jgi:rare lipoprotein A
MLDVSRAAAEALGFLKRGTAKLKVTVISGPLS